ncbi:cytochrome P450 [Mycobacterium intermedium]|uniref:Cytochrome P450 n=1 Tax=Mycobacterium intermedium TaxID=28445 RepID=A0A1E3SLM7_MYCIE|nr:cytochrome P450 [Mycobacterium intermedium]MCV6964786.1 cytochrome P450 [Mycobacterium intermedium]ODR03046.1 cytochrome [Mycobacterium intermedium]OPE48350.1 cytochrome P450 [Mycobacterium intermedium]ORB02391.1 cytochrome P450 [Mycobacterium intermedium]
MSLSTDRFDSEGQALALDFTGETSPYPFFEQMRRTDPVWHGSLQDTSQIPEELRPKDEWVLFGYDDVFHAFRDDRIFTSAEYDKTIGLVMGHTILAMGGKEHHDHRNLVAKAFRATALERWEPSVIGPVCDALVDEIKERGEADLVKAVTFEFPTRIISVLLGLPPEDLDLFRRLSLDLISIPTDIMAGLTAAAELHGYFLEQVEQRRRKPTDDIIGDLVAAEIDGEKLSDEAIIAFLRLLLPAGLETTYRSSGNLLYLLLTHPEQLDMVYRDRSLIPMAIEEGLRFETPLTMVTRTTTQDVEIGGKTIPEGAQVDMCMGSANRDETRWTDPNTFDIRRPRQAHISFAGGIHMCLGMHLARMETRVMLNSLFDRVQDLTFVADDGTGVESKIVGLTFRSPNKLPVTFAPAP